ncbi:hypothetical protein [Aureimonas glaciei]|uniref:Uncharacterized protein n=1 Tax=Aureimonas glaciei TaxID=1776957 RepID=A0A916YBM0_9HYPH|nr:hypothetical protein [Aureimonas glaciei]GGD38264.1 hypothetical protein GCM10011335_46230 [Aureimonas glaciei]
MDRRDYLPKVVAHGPDALADMDDVALMRLQVECIEWLVTVRDFKNEVTAPNAVAVWNALIELEIAMVTAADAMIEDVWQSRRDDEQ